MDEGEEIEADNITIVVEEMVEVVEWILLVVYSNA